jgi:pimeloyl-ACP methyl ester carboxylesterase
MTRSPEVFEFAGDGVRLVGERWTAENPRGVVVLLHGGGQTRHSWARTAQRLSVGGWTAIATDARGHGDSDWHSAGDYALDAFVADLVALADGLESPPVLVGASLGGITSLVAAGEHPSLARAIVLVDIVIELEREGTARILDFLGAHRDGFATLEEVAEAIAAYNPLRDRPRNLDGLRKNVRRREDGRWYWHWDPAFIQIGDEPQREADPERLRAAAANLRVPTLLVRGGSSDVVSDDGVADMRRLIPAADTIVVPGAGHMVAGDDNDVFVTGVEAFLDRLN